jgi:hypothetical protein
MKAGRVSPFQAGAMFAKLVQLYISLMDGGVKVR